MQTLSNFADLLLGFIPAIGIIAILLGAFWIATKLIPSLDEWMRDTRDMEAAQEYTPKHITPAPQRLDRWM
jgi:hypothetical protein